ncbi:hypothetical protein JCM8547_007387 [Rhodosporidiobolus lusitaniae]
MTEQTVILLGGTGEVGSKTLAALLESPFVSRVHSYGRTSPEVDQAHTSKFTHTPFDFDALLAESTAPGAESKKLSEVGADAVIIALGTTRKNAGSAERFEKIDREYVLAAGKAARREDKTQRLVYVSSAGSDSSSWFLYPKSKGLTEEGLAAIGYNETFIFRPGYLAVPGGRNESRIAETAFGTVTNALSSFSSSLQIPTPVLGKALVKAATLVPPSALKVSEYGKAEQLKGKEVWAVNNAAALKLGDATSPRI